VCGLDDRILVQLVVFRGFVDQLVNPPAQFGQDRHLQVVVIQHQQLIILSDGDRAIVQSPIQPMKSVRALDRSLSAGAYK